MTQEPPNSALAGRRLVGGFTVGYWMLNTIEMFERLAYYLVRSVGAIISLVIFARLARRWSDMDA